jgi:hypothetical protein
MHRRQTAMSVTLKAGYVSATLFPPDAGQPFGNE